MSLVLLASRVRSDTTECAHGKRYVYLLYLKDGVMYASHLLVILLILKLHEKELHGYNTLIAISDINLVFQVTLKSSSYIV